MPPKNKAHPQNIETNNSIRSETILDEPIQAHQVDVTNQKSALKMTTNDVSKPKLSVEFEPSVKSNEVLESDLLESTSRTRRESRYSTTQTFIDNQIYKELFGNKRENILDEAVQGTKIKCDRHLATVGLFFFFDIDGNGELEPHEINSLLNLTEMQLGTDFRDILESSLWPDKEISIHFEDFEQAIVNIREMSESWDCDISLKNLDDFIDIFSCPENIILINLGYIVSSLTAEIILMIPLGFCLHVVVGYVLSGILFFLIVYLLKNYNSAPIEWKIYFQLEWRWYVTFLLSFACAYTYVFAIDSQSIYKAEVAFPFIISRLCHFALIMGHVGYVASDSATALERDKILLELPNIVEKEDQNALSIFRLFSLQAVEQRKKVSKVQEALSFSLHVIGCLLFPLINIVNVVYRPKAIYASFCADITSWLDSKFLIYLSVVVLNTLNILFSTILFEKEILVIGSDYDSVNSILQSINDSLLPATASHARVRYLPLAQEENRNTFPKLYSFILRHYVGTVLSDSKLFIVGTIILIVSLVACVIITFFVHKGADLPWNWMSSLIYYGFTLTSYGFYVLWQAIRINNQREKIFVNLNAIKLDWLVQKQSGKAVDSLHDIEKAIKKTFSSFKIMGFEATPTLIHVLCSYLFSAAVALIWQSVTNFV